MSASLAFAAGVLGASAAVLLAGEVRGRLVPIDRARDLVEVLLSVGRQGRRPGALERRRLLITGSLILLTLGFLVGGARLALPLALAGPFAVSRLLAARRERYRRAVVAAAPALTLAVSDAIGAGHSIRGAIEQAAGGLRGPVAGELRRVHAEMVLGAGTDAAIEGLRRRVAAHELDAIAAAIVMQRRAGGDLARLLRELSHAFEQNTMLTGEARAATAQARFTGLIVVLLPLGGAALAEIASPGFITGLFGNPLAASLLVLAILMQAGATVAIRRLARAERP